MAVKAAVGHSDRKPTPEKRGSSEKEIAVKETAEVDESDSRAESDSTQPAQTEETADDAAESIEVGSCADGKEEKQITVETVETETSAEGASEGQPSTSADENPPKETKTTQQGRLKSNRWRQLTG